MEKKAYECNSCGYTIFVVEDDGKDNACPTCRSNMFRADIPKPDSCAEYACEECGAKFCVPEGAMNPYKCPRCNSTFPATPDRNVKHKL